MNTDPYKFIGTTIANRYRIESLLGMGGMAAVYQARHLVTTRTVAIKILKPDLAWQNETAVEKFIAEARAMARLNHRHIIEVMDADLAENGVAFLAMQRLHGQTLDKVLEHSGPMKLERVADLLEQLCDGVEHAHNAGIVHRDLKPGNIMIEREGRGDEFVKILDFGIAKALGGTTSVSQPVGTLYYASPEQLTTGSDLDHRSDIYSLGVILFQMLVGEAPFDDADSMERVLYQKLNLPPPRLRDRRPDLPEAVEDVVMKALATPPTQRYHQATELARAFRHAIRLEPGALILECSDLVTKRRVANASVYLNGKFAGQTDGDGVWSRSDLPPRQYLIEVESPPHQTWRDTIHAGSREEVAVSVELERRPKGQLVVVCKTPGATVWLDGEKAGVTDQTGRLPLEEIAAGRRRIRIARPRHLPAEGEVEIKAGESSFIELKLEPKAFEIPKTAAIGAGAALLIGVLAIPQLRARLFGGSHPPPSPEISVAETASPDPTSSPSPSIPPTIGPGIGPAAETAAASPASRVPATTPATVRLATPKPAAKPARSPIIRVDSHDLALHARTRQFPAWRNLLPGVRLSGNVNVEVTIDENGNATPGRASSRTPDLQSPAVLNAARKAARQWKFAPFERDGRKVKAQGAITFPVNLF